jgi:hypothetical protein
MSFPVQAMPSMVSAVGPFELAVQSVNTSPIFTGLMMLCMNLGGRFLPFEISKSQEAILQHPYFRRFMIFVLLFMATRNIITAFWMSIVIILCIGYFFNENSSLCVWQGGFDGSTCATKEGFTDVPDLTPEEQDILNKLKEKEAKVAEARSKSVTSPTTKKKVPIEKYKKNMENVKTA